MRIAIIASGSRGDIEPYLALAEGLTAAGHIVRLVTHENFAALAQSYGVEFWPVAGNVQDVAQSDEMRRLLDKGNFLAIMREMAAQAKMGALALAQAGLAACAGIDLIVAGIGGVFIGLALAEKLGLPLVQAYYLPFTPTRAYPSFIAPKLPTFFGGAANRLTYHVARQIMWQSFRPADQLARREVLELPPAPLMGPYQSRALRRMPILYGYSPAVIPPAADWDAATHVTGYWLLDPPADWAPPADLVAFLEAGPPPVFVGFGSMSNRHPEQTAELILAALAQTHQRAVLLSGWDGLRMTDWPDSVFPVKSVPFAWLFPRMAAVVHHGGAGTTAAGLRAGVPSIVIPFFGDQPFWGQRVADLGVGPAPIPRRKLTVARLARAIARVADDQAMRQRAAQLGARIRTEDGVARAVSVIAQIAAQP